MDGTFKDSISNIRYFLGLYVIYVVVAVGLSVAEIYLNLGLLGIIMGLVDIVVGLFIVARIDQEKQNGIIQVTSKKAFSVVATQAMLVIVILVVIGVFTLISVAGALWVVVLLTLIAVVPLTMLAWGIYLLPVYILDSGTGYIRGIVNCYKYVSGYKSYIFWEATKLGFLLGLVPLAIFLGLLASGTTMLDFSKESMEAFQSIAMCFITPFMVSNTYEIYVRIREAKMPTSIDSLMEAVGDGLGDSQPY